jgi:crotonobetainyl-CoA:carnitine CoA-transferase CaiB-like acyl-CoA transferase
MTTENIFSRVKVLDLASFIAGPSADVIKVEPPSGRYLETCAQAPAAAARLAVPLLPVGHRNHSNGGQD